MLKYSFKKKLFSAVQFFELMDFWISVQRFSSGYGLILGPDSPSSAFYEIVYEHT